MYKTYYEKYLGLEGEETILASDQRRIPLNKHYYYSAIATQVEGRVVYSLLPEWVHDFKTHLSTDRSDMAKVLEDFNNKLGLGHSLRHMYRMSYHGQRLQDNPAVVYTEDLVRAAFKDRPEAIQGILERNREAIDLSCKFAVVIEGSLASMAKISDVDHGGGNIAVYTGPEFRGKGYGRYVVDACVAWCQERNIEPVYLVEVHNKPSVNLARSLGFSIASEEWILSKEA